MKSQFTLATALACLWALNVAANTNNPTSEVETFTSVLSENSRAVRALENLRNAQGIPVQSSKRSAQAPQRPSNIVYGKGRVAEQPKFNRHSVAAAAAAAAAQQKVNKPSYSKFSASPEDSGIENDNPFGQYKLNAVETAALQKYMQKYANQLYAAQKHAQQLSESQKFVLGQDPYSKKYVVPQQHKHKVNKFIPVPATQEPKLITAAEPSRFQDDSFENFEPTEKYQSIQVAQKLSVGVKAAKNPPPPKKAYSFIDNSPQSSDSKFNKDFGVSTSETQVNQYLSTYAAPEKEAYSSFEPQGAYVQYGVGLSGLTDKAAELPSIAPKISGYKIPGALSLNLGHASHTIEEKGHHEQVHEEHYPSHEPKYEFMYQVKDPEKHNHFGHTEARKGKTTWGKYYVQLPDGRFETVKYWADKTGYHAEVDFKGHAKHPSPKEHGVGHGGLFGHQGYAYDKSEDGGLGGTSYVGHGYNDKADEAGLSSVAEQNEEIA